jgi:hypothetical protein
LAGGRRTAQLDGKSKVYRILRRLDIAPHCESGVWTSAATPNRTVPLYYGVVQNCNAGVVTIDAQYLNCATVFIGYADLASQ